MPTDKPRVHQPAAPNSAHASDGLVPAWVLHRRAWRETSLLLDAFTREQGRVALVARGLRGPKSRHRGLAEPFRPLLLSWRGRGEMGTVQGMEAAGTGPVLAGQALWCGFYLNELLVSLLPRHAPAPALWIAYSAALSELARVESRALALRRFEVALLDELGVLPDLAHEAGGGAPVSATSAYRLDPDRGPLPAPPGARDTVPGSWLLCLSGRTHTEVAHAARGVTRRLLDAQLDGRALRTRELLRQLS